jgi:hypothetical protein
MTTSAASIGVEPLDLRTPFTSAEAAAAKISRRRLTSAEFVRLFQGIYISRNVTRTVKIRATAALRLAPPVAIISHHTATLLWGGAVPGSSKIHLILPAELNCQKVGIQPHRFLHPPKSSLHQGIRITHPERTFCDLGSYLDLVELVVLGDRFVRRSVTTPERLRFEANNWTGDHATVLRRAALLVRAGVDSPPESRPRMLVVLAGLPEPTVNDKIRHPTTGDVERRFELAHEALRLAIEYQGRHHRDAEDVWASDIEREEEVRERRDWRIVQIISDGLNKRPLLTLRRIDQARVERGAHPVVFREEWRRFFPGDEVN